MEKNHL